MTSLVERTADASSGARREHRPGRPLLGVRLGHLIVWEAAALLLAAGLTAPDPVGVPALAGAGLLLVATVARVRRRWLYDWVLTRLRHLGRRRPRRRGRAGQEAGPLGPLRGLLPSLSVSRAGGRSRIRMGVVHDGRAWIALVGVDEDEPAALAPLPRPARVPASGARPPPGRTCRAASASATERRHVGAARPACARSAHVPGTA
ncbi:MULTISPECIES: hypothetical protein [Streptomyces]|uniref:Type VII secretion protein EccE n=2 Tax=Streptomyces TaxID=1883 RepID=A0ABV9IMS4_9ACTN